MFQISKCRGSSGHASSCHSPGRQSGQPALWICSRVNILTTETFFAQAYLGDLLQHSNIRSLSQNDMPECKALKIITSLLGAIEFVHYKTKINLQDLEVNAREEVSLRCVLGILDCLE